MAETLTDPTLHGPTPEAHAPQSTPQAEARGFRDAVRQAGEKAYSFLDLSAGITLAARGIRNNRERLDAINNSYGGIMERQTASDVVSIALETDLILDYRRDAQRAGFTDVDAMPADLREQVVENAVRNRAGDIIAELESHHPDWSREQLAEAAALRISDIITLLSMSAEQRDDYRRELFNYRDTQGNIAALETKMETMREERRDRVSAFGRVTVGVVMGMVNAVQNVPNNISARTAVAGMTLREKVGEWYQSRSPEGKKATVLTAASLAIAGIATYMSMRFAAGYEGGSRSGIDYKLAGGITNTDAQIDTVSGQAPEVADTIGVAPETITGYAPAVAETIGDPNDHILAGTAPQIPETVTGEAPDVAENIGTTADTTAPEVPKIGGDLRSAQTTSELFGKGDVQFWPDTVTVSAWDSQTKDGSLWGISEEMLQRSGVKNPSDAQIDTLVDALRPQAGPNGLLQEGQTLNLRPAIDLLSKLS